MEINFKYVVVFKIVFYVNQYFCMKCPPLYFIFKYLKKSYKCIMLHKSIYKEFEEQLFFILVYQLLFTFLQRIFVYLNHFV